MAIANIELPKSGYTGKGLPPLAKNVIVIGSVIIGAAILGIVSWKIYKYAKGAHDRKLTANEGKEGAQDLKDKLALGMKPSFDDSQYATWANMLKQAFDGCGTSNGVWQKVYGSLRNDVDVLKLNAAYGTRTFDGCNWEFDFGDFTGTLSQALVNELSASEIVALNGMLTKAGIKFQY